MYKWSYDQQAIEGLCCDQSEYVAREPGVYRCQVTDSKGQRKSLEIEVKLYSELWLFCGIWY